MIWIEWEYSINCLYYLLIHSLSFRCKTPLYIRDSSKIWFKKYRELTLEIKNHIKRYIKRWKNCSVFISIITYTFKIPKVMTGAERLSITILKRSGRIKLYMKNNNILYSDIHSITLFDIQILKEIYYIWNYFNWLLHFNWFELRWTQQCPHSYVELAFKFDFSFETFFAIECISLKEFIRASWTSNNLAVHIRQLNPDAIIYD